MKEKEIIRLMQFLVSNEELYNSSSISEDTAKYYLEEFKKQKEDYVKEKQYFIVFHDLFLIDLAALPINYKFDSEDFKEYFKNTSLQVFDSKKEVNPIERKGLNITKETKDFLKAHCNIERNVVGVDTYVLNNLRFTIEEE